MRKLLIVLLIVFTVNYAFSQKYLKYNTEGIELFKQKKYKEADSLFSLAIKKQPKSYKNPDSYFNRGRTRLYLLDTSGYCSDMESAADKYNDYRAIKQYKKSCLEFNDDAYNFFLKGSAEFDLKKYKSSESLFTLSIDSYEFLDNVYMRGIARLYMLDTIGFCSDMKRIYHFDKRARQNSEIYCGVREKPLITYYTSDIISLGSDSIEVIRETKDTLFYGEKIDTEPKFKGGQMELKKFIANNLKYPGFAQHKKIQGKVVVEFIIGKDGYIRCAKIIEKLYPSLDKEALRVVGLMPQWKPALSNNKPVAVKFTFPFVWKLN
jgi:TonB family protein